MTFGDTGVTAESKNLGLFLGGSSRFRHQKLWCVSSYSVSSLSGPNKIIKVAHSFIDVLMHSTYM